MDSTLVHQITDLASRLGMEARTVFVWWLLSKFCIHALWAGVLLLVVMRTLRLLGNIGNGMRLVDAVEKSSGTNYPDSMHFARAIQGIRDAFGNTSNK